MIVYGIKNCNTVKSAVDWLKKHSMEFEFHDYKKSGITKAKLAEWSKQVGWESLVNKRGTTWRVFAVVNGRLEERVVQRGPELPGGKVALIRGATAGEQVASPIVDAKGAILDRVVDGVAVAK